MKYRIYQKRFDLFLPSDHLLTSKQYVENISLFKNNNLKLSSLIKEYYKEFKYFVDLISLKLDEKLTNPLINKTIKKSSLINLFNDVVKENHILYKINYYDINKDIVVTRFFKYYYNNIETLTSFYHNKIDKNKLYKNLIFIKLMQENLEVYVGKYLRYGKINGVTKKYKYEYDFIFKVNNLFIAINFKDDDYKYKSLLNLKNYQRIYITLEDIETHNDKNDILNINLDKFLSL